MCELEAVMTDGGDRCSTTEDVMIFSTLEIHLNADRSFQRQSERATLGGFEHVLM